MKILRFFAAVFVMAELTFSWTVPKVNGQDYYSQEDPNKKILKEAVLGAGVGAVSSGASGGSAGKGALIGAGTNVIGSAVLDTLTSSQNTQPQPQIQYVQQPTESGYAVVNSSPRNRGCGKSG